MIGALATLRIEARNHRTPRLWISYLLLAILLTWPTVRHLTTHLPGDGGDDPAIAWNLWWVKHALLVEGQNPFHTDFMFYPIGINLAFYTLTVLNALTALPFTLNLGLVPASNLHLLFTFVSGGYGAFLLARYVLTRFAARTDESISGRLGPIDHNLSWISAAIAGGVYAFAGSKLFYVALGQFNIASNHWVPFAILYFLRSHHHPQRLKNPLMAALFLTLQAWTEMTYASFLLVFMGLYWLYWILTTLIAQKGNLRSGILPIIVSQGRVALVMVVTFGLGIMPILSQLLPDMRLEGDFLVEGGGFADIFSADLVGFFIPTMHHPFLGHLITQSQIASFDKGQHIYIGFILSGLGLVALFSGFRQARVRFWLIAMAAFALLALGPVITLNGQPTGLDGPFTIFQTLPFFKGNRYPSRYSVMLMLSFSVIVALALVKIGSWTRSRRYWLFALISGLFLLEHLSLPLPQSDMRIPAAYQLLMADPDEVTVLDIPFAWRNGFRITGPFTTQFMFGQFYQTKHQKRLLQGNTSRNPEFKFQYFTRAPVLNSLLALESGKTLPPERLAADRTMATEVFRFFNIKYVVIRPHGPHNPGVTPEATLPYIETLLPVEKIHDTASLKLYRLPDSGQTPGLPAGLHIQPDSPLAPLYFGEGWGLLSPGRPVTAQRKEVRLLLPLSVAPQRVTVRMRLPEAARVTHRSIYLELNGWQSASQPLAQAWQEHRFEIPAHVIRSELSDLRLHFDAVTTLQPLQARTTTVDVTALSAGEEVGGFGHIYVNGYEISPNQRGYNLAVIKPGGSFDQDPPALLVDSFDTHLDPTASAKLADYLAPFTAAGWRWGDEAIVAMVAADEASLNLDQEAVRAIQQVTGASGDLRGCFRCSHAIIRELGSSSGGLAEALDPLQPVGVTTGLGLTEPNLAAVVAWIRIEPLVE